MSFKPLMFGLTAAAIGLIAFSEYNKGQEFAEGVANSPSEGEAAKPSVGNLVEAFGIALGGFNGGQMRSASGSSDPRLVTDPLKTRSAEFYGWNVSHPGLIGPGDEMFLVQSALAGVPMNQPVETPAAIDTRTAEADCRAPAPAAGERLAKVMAHGSSQPSGYHAVTQSDLAQGAAAYIVKVQRAASPDEHRPSGETRPVNTVNVVITDETAPLYLVLQAGGSPLLFNLHPTSGVEIARIVVVGQPGSAVSAPDPETPVHFLETFADCAPQPWRAAQPWWGLYTGILGPQYDHEKTSIESHETYEAWFSGTFGSPSDEGTIGGWDVTHVLVGPLPATAEARAPYRPLTGARITALEGPLLYAVPERERMAEIASRRLALATAAAGGDLSIVNPAPMERTQ